MILIEAVEKRDDEFSTVFPLCVISLSCTYFDRFIKRGETLIRTNYNSLRIQVLLLFQFYLCFSCLF